MKKDREKRNFKEVKNNFGIISINISSKINVHLFLNKKSLHKILFNKIQVYDEDI